MSQIDRRLRNVQQADLTESRVNDDFVHWLKTWGNNILLVILVAAALAMGWFWWQQKQQKQRDDAWAELEGASLPAALQEVAAQHADRDAIAQFAELEAADRYMAAIRTNRRFDREATAADAALTPALREEWLRNADRLYAKVAERAANPKGTGERGFLLSALFGRAAVAEDLGDGKAAEGFLKDAQSKAEGTDLAPLGELAAKRIASLATAAVRIEMPSRPPMPTTPAAIPNLGEAPPLSSTAPAAGATPAGTPTPTAADLMAPAPKAPAAPAPKAP